MRRIGAAAVLLLVLCGTAFCDDFDIGAALKSTFGDLALIPTRLTYYNQHEDAALASYTCCKVKQETQIQAALVANAAFLNRFADTPYADDTYMHYAYVSGFKPEAFRNQEWGYRNLVELFPDSDLADDGAWMLGNLYEKDYDHERAIKCYEHIAKKWPDSTWADDALWCLINEYAQVEDNDAALEALNQLAYDYPKSEYCPQALNLLSSKYMEIEDYVSSINAASDLITDFRYNDLADDCQYRIAQCYRLMGEHQNALAAYDRLVKEWYGSSFTNRAMREANNLVKLVRGNTQQATGDLYDPLAWNPEKEANELWFGEAKHFQNNGHHSEAIAKFREFIEKFPGNDMWDDAWYEIGQTYLRQHFLFEEINKATGPEDIFRLREDYVASTGDEGAVPTHGKLSAKEDAAEAFAHICNNLKGSSLQCEALGWVARCHIPYGNIDEGPVTPDAAFTYQEVVINFPFNNCKLPFFTDASVPVFSFCKLMTFYADPNNWEIAQQIYPDLSAEYPGVFPTGLETDKDAFYELMKLYNAKIAFAYYEMSKHIKYAISPSELLPEAHYFQAAMLMSRGDFKRAAELLLPLTQMRGQDLVGPSLFLYAQANVKLGNWNEAKTAFSLIVDEHASSGLADDAELCWRQYEELKTNPAKYDLTEPVKQVYEKYGVNPAFMDTYIGDGCVVFAPYSRTALMRMYNMPNVWDEAQKALREWAGLSNDKKVVVVVDTGCKSTYGDPFMVPGCQIKDPPQWSLGLSQIAANVLGDGIPQLAKNRDLLDGIGEFAAASLQYELVTETRDAIGSAAAVKLPQEDVIKARRDALAALEKYVIDGEDAKMTREVVSGMLYSLLDANGFSKDRLIDREPYRVFFAELKKLSGETLSGEAFSSAAEATFGEGCRQQLKDWRLPLAKTASTKDDVQVGMLQ